MATDILPIPEIPRTLLVAAQRRKLVPFIGAGVSRLAGAPDWSEFAKNTLRYLASNGKLSDAECNELLILSPRVQLSIAHNLQDPTVRIDYEKILHPSGSLDNLDGKAVYRNLGRLSKVFVTTNYDRWLDEAIPEEITLASGSIATTLPASLRRTCYHAIDDFRPDRLDIENAVFHIHGSVNSGDSMVVTTRDYLTHYKSGSNKIGQQNNLTNFLTFLFAQRNLLFIGYSLNELEVLEYIIQKSDSIDARREDPRHFILLPFNSSQNVLVRHLDKYYREHCNVELLPYRLDENGYSQLTSVIDQYARDLQPIGTSATLDLEDMEALLIDE